MVEWPLSAWILHIMFSVAGFFLFDAKRRGTYDHQLIYMYICVGLFATASIFNQIYHEVFL